MFGRHINELQSSSYLSVPADYSFQSSLSLRLRQQFVSALPAGMATREAEWTW